MTDKLQRLDAESPMRQEPQDLLALAVQKGADVATLERLMVVRKELLAERAKTSYFASLAAFQAECPIIVKSRGVVIEGSERYKYAPMDRIISQVGPLLEKHGFSVQRDTEVDDKWVRAVVTVTHRDGHSETKSFKVPAESRAGMSPQQKYGAAATFAERYAFCGALGIRTGDTDNDAVGRSEGPETVAQLKAQLWALLKPVRGEENNWNVARQWMVDEMCLDPELPIKEMTVDHLKATIKAVQKKLTK